MPRAGLAQGREVVDYTRRRRSSNMAAPKPNSVGALPIELRSTSGTTPLLLFPLLLLLLLVPLLLLLLLLLLPAAMAVPAKVISPIVRARLVQRVLKRLIDVSSL